MAADDNGDDSHYTGDTPMNERRTANGDVVNISDDPRLQPSEEDVTYIATHVIYWPLYLTCVFPLQALYHLVRYIWSNTILVAIVLAPFDLLRGTRYLRFATPRERLLLFLRASWVVTPSEVCPWLYAHAEYKGSATADLASQGDDWEAVAQQVFERDGHTCTCCGAEGGEHGSAQIEADRIVPYERGGFVESENMRTLCRPCHDARHAEFFEDIDEVGTAR